MSLKRALHEETSKASVDRATRLRWVASGTKTRKLRRDAFRARTGALLASLALGLSCSGGSDGWDRPSEGGEGGTSTAEPRAGRGGSKPGISGAVGSGEAGRGGWEDAGGSGGASVAGSPHPEAGVSGQGAGGTAGVPESGTAGDGGSGTGGSQGGACSRAEIGGSGPDALQNAGFELGLGPWTVSGDVSAAYVESLNPHNGARNLALRGSDAYSVAVEQDICELTEGGYTLRAWVKSSTTLGPSHFYFSSASGEEQVPIPAGLSSALRINIERITVTECPCKVGVRVSGPAGSWAALDDVELLSGAPTVDPAYLLGGDITFRRQLMDSGAKFYDAEGNEADVLDTLAQSGANFARIRIYNHPGSPDHYPSNQFVAGYQDAAEALVSAREAADRGMNTVISFHYSDYWTNPETQAKPHEWAELGAQELEQAVHDYTYATMAALAAQGTPPLIVALGNETNFGMLWPEGQINYQGTNFEQFAKLFNAGARAVKEVFPTAKVAVHLSKPEGRPDLWLGWAAAKGLEYDTIGLSLYPFWSGLRIRDMKNVVQRLIEATGKDVVALESGFPWSLTRPSGYPTLIASNSLSPQGQETFGVSPVGQERYMRSFFQQMHEVPGFLGAIYWDPIWIDTPGLASNVADTALFDWQGRPLPALNAFEEKYW